MYLLRVLDLYPYVDALFLSLSSFTRNELNAPPSFLSCVSLLTPKHHHAVSRVYASKSQERQGPMAPARPSVKSETCPSCLVSYQSVRLPTFAGSVAFQDIPTVTLSCEPLPCLGGGKMPEICSLLLKIDHLHEDTKDFVRQSAGSGSTYLPAGDRYIPR